MIDGPDRAPARSMMRAVGYTDEDFRRPLIGVAHSWIEIMPCNINQRELAGWVKEGIREAGGTPVEMNTIAVSDGIAMGTEGMKASLISRELVADSIELVARGHLFDALVCVSGCDKTIPGTVMALARLDIPGLMVYGGSIMPGRFQGRDVTIGDVFEAVGKHAVGAMSDAELRELEGVACPGAGACGGQFTANTMSTAFEMLGISPMGFNGVPAADPKKAEVAFESGGLVMELLRKGVTPRSIITKRALLNAIAGVMATGGSTNAVLHLLAVAREAGVRLSIDEFDRISRRTPLLADMKPWGRFTAPEMHEAGGMAVVAMAPGKLLPSPWEFKKHGDSGVEISSLFPQVARFADDLCVVRSLHTNGQAHGQAIMKLHTGSENQVRPSVGSWILYGLGTENQNLPGFITISPLTAIAGPQAYGSAFLPAI